ncbi:MAG: hypothetical protein LBL74_07635 [Bacteroidales bacterium]|jgi:hypothetical protein|nr:hypothetical protein [Bacteroidales bacterium]
MKRNIIKIFALVVLVALSTTMFSCMDDTDCRLKVIVKDVRDQNVRYPNAKVVVSKGNGNVKQNGVTDANGEAFFTFDMEAIFDIGVTYSTYDTLISPDTIRRTGKSTVSLKAGEIVEKDVLLQL